MATTDRPSATDAAVAAAVAVVAGAGLLATPTAQEGFTDPGPLAAALVVGAALLLAARRLAPAATVAGVWAATAAYLALGHFPTTTVLVAPVVAGYSAGAHLARHRARAGAVLLAAALGGSLLLAVAEPPDLTFAEAAAVFLLLGSAAVVGDRVRTRRQYLAGLEEGARLREREREARERVAVAAERARIARELHDVVAHGVSVIVLHARGAQAALDADPAAARRSLALIESTGREALDELRTVVGALQEGEAGGDLSPQPGLDDLDRLVGSTREAGLGVDLQVEGEVRPVAAAVGLSAYRIVQEALANVLKHSTADRARVVVRYDRADLVVQVTDEGEPRRAAAAGGGFGLVGMRQRAALLGGRLEAGPRPEGGFDVLAVLPLREAG